MVAALYDNIKEIQVNEKVGSMVEDRESSDFHKRFPDFKKRGTAFEEGERNFARYDEEGLLKMLKSGDAFEVYMAFGAIGKLQLKKALPYLKAIALYDDDMETQEDAIRTIRRIWGRDAFDILTFLKTTEHKDFVEKIIAHKPDWDGVDD